MSDRFTVHKFGRGHYGIIDTEQSAGVFTTTNMIYNTRHSDAMEDLCTLMNQLDTQAEKDPELSELDFEEETHA